MKKIAKWTLVLLLLAAVFLCGSYLYYDQESVELTNETRATLSGQFVELQEGFVHYELAGPDAAEVVVLVHGFSVPYYIWDPTFAALVDSGFQVLRFDMYGRGYSDRPDVEYDFALFAEQLNQLLAALHFNQPVNLAGLSMGGPVVAKFASEHPEKVRRVTLVDPMVSSPSREDIGPYDLAIVGEYLMTVSRAPGMAESQLVDFYRPENYQDWPDRYREQMRYGGFRKAILSTIRNLPDNPPHEIYRALNTTRLPVQLFWGTEDQTVAFELSEVLIRIIPRIEFHAIDEAGHLPHYERPEEVNPMLVDFLRRDETITQKN